LLAVPRAQPVPELVIAGRPTASLTPLQQRFRSGQRARLVAQHIKIMLEIKHICRLPRGVAGRLLHEARLPRMKTLDAFEFDRSGVSAAQLRTAGGDHDNARGGQSDDQHARSRHATDGCVPPPGCPRGLVPNTGWSSTVTQPCLSTSGNTTSARSRPSVAHDSRLPRSMTIAAPTVSVRPSRIRASSARAAPAGRLGGCSLPPRAIGVVDAKATVLAPALD